MEIGLKVLVFSRLLEPDTQDFLARHFLDESSIENLSDEQWERLFDELSYDLPDYLSGVSLPDEQVKRQISEFIREHGYGEENSYSAATVAELLEYDKEEVLFAIFVQTLKNLLQL